MSQTVIFSVGFAVFALTVWGAIMAGGIWFAQLAQYDDDDREAVDLIAERIRSLGAPAPGSYREFANLSSVTEDDDRPGATEMIRRLVEAQETVARTARSIFPVVEKAHDEPTADLLTQRLQVHEKTAWMLRSLLA